MGMSQYVFNPWDVSTVDNLLVFSIPIFHVFLVPHFELTQMSTLQAPLSPLILSRCHTSHSSDPTGIRAATVPKATVGLESGAHARLQDHAHFLGLEFIL